MMKRVEEIILKVLRFVGNTVGVGADKVAHFICCLIASVSLGFVFGYETGFIGALMLGIGKEYGDHCALNNRWSWGDIAADFVGALVGMIIVLV